MDGIIMSAQQMSVSKQALVSEKGAHVTYRPCDYRIIRDYLHDPNFRSPSSVLHVFLFSYLTLPTCKAPTAIGMTLFTHTTHMPL